jgi:hypothetical protein
VTYSFAVVPRYAEIDQQGVVFNGHYLTWFDEAFTGFLEHVGLPYPKLIASGVDVMVVHSELDYGGSVRWRDDALHAGVHRVRVGGRGRGDRPQRLRRRGAGPRDRRLEQGGRHPRGAGGGAGLTPRQ